MDEGSVLAFPQAPDAIELRHLRAFVAVAEELNFGRAAERLYISQPALSRQIRSLERLVGCELLRRTTHRVELTIAGEALLERARRLLRDLDEAVTATQAVGGELTGRMARLWQPVMDAVADGADLEEIRAAYEALNARFDPPPEVGIRPVNADGVPSLVLTPPGDAPTALLYLHGGGHVLGSAFGIRHLAGALASAAETAALVPDYRLAPEHPFPAGLEDAVRAYRWLIGRGLDPERITVAGDSSGAALAVSVLIALKERELPLPSRALLFCPGIDLTGQILERMAPNEEEAAIARDATRRFVAAWLDGHPIDDPRVDPLGADLAGLPPLLIQAATGDMYVESAQLLAERAREHGVDVRLDLYPAETHVFQIFWSFLPEAADALREAGRFVQAARAEAPAAGDASA